MPPNATDDQAESHGDAETDHAETDTESETKSDLQRRLATVQSELAETEADLAAKEAEIAEKEAALAETREKLAEAETARETAERAREAAEERLEEKEAEITRFRENLREQAAEREREATRDLVERLVAEVRDPLVRALSADGDVREGVELTLAEFDRVLDDEANAEVIHPEQGTAVEETRHVVAHRAPSGDGSDRVLDVERPGFEMDGEVVVKARVVASK
jgi:molecular chaperone GrpE